MKRLYLMRHAKSSWDDPELADIDRPLNHRGEKDAPRMGKRLRERMVSPCLILSSPANRAYQTAMIIAGEIGYPEKKILVKKSIYGGGVSAMLNIILHLSPELESVMIFGHNPEITSLANELIAESIDHIPTCGVCCIDFDVDVWKDISRKTGRVVFFDRPKKQS